MKGKYIKDRICFLNASYSLRTDESFATNAYKT